jgi:hypothetical protein
MTHRFRSDSRVDENGAAPSPRALSVVSADDSVLTEDVDAMSTDGDNVQVNGS